MLDLDTDFAPPRLAVGWPVLLVLGLASLLLYSWLAVLAWRVIG